MRKYSQFKDNYLKNTIIKNSNNSHIKIIDKKTCREQCDKKPCTYYCPTGVFFWLKEEKQIKVDYKRCVECGACPLGCPHENIKWTFPPGGYGVKYQF